MKCKLLVPDKFWRVWSTHKPNTHQHSYAASASRFGRRFQHRSWRRTNPGSTQTKKCQVSANLLPLRFNSVVLRTVQSLTRPKCQKTRVHSRWNQFSFMECQFRVKHSQNTFKHTVSFIWYSPLFRDNSILFFFSSVDNGLFVQSTKRFDHIICVIFVSIHLFLFSAQCTEFAMRNGIHSMENHSF